MRTHGYLVASHARVAHATACETGKQAAPARVVCDWTGGGAPHRILAVTAWSSYAVGLRVPTSTVTSDPAGKRWPAEGCWATTRWTCPESLTCTGTIRVPSCAWASTSLLESDGNWHRLQAAFFRLIRIEIDLASHHMLREDHH